MLSQHSDKPFNGSKNGPVNHGRPVLGSIRPDISQVEPFRHGEIDLNGAALPASLQGIFDMKVDLWTVKGTFTRIDCEVYFLRFQRLFQSLLRIFPHLVSPDGFGRSGGKLDFIFSKSEITVYVGGQVNEFYNFGTELINGTIYVRIVLDKGSNTEETAEYSFQFVSVDEAQFRHPEGQIPIRV